MNDFFSIVIIVGIFITFTPQQVRIVKRRSSLGISPHFMLLGIVSGISQLINIIILQVPVLDDCKRGSETCSSDVLGIVQVSVLTMSLALNWCLFLMYYPRPWNASAEGRHVISCVRLFYMFVGLCMVVIPVFVIAGKGWTRGMGQFFGIFCTLLSCVQYLPQIYRTWHTKHIGALSVTTLIIQAPGSFFFAYTLAVRPSTDITTWGSFFISGTFQVMLVALCLYIKRAGGHDEEDPLLDEHDPDEYLEHLERQPILPRL
jgi:uncharacterized protein with PQ loop repeat